jgi:hypothetical protein
MVSASSGLSKPTLIEEKRLIKWKQFKFAKYCINPPSLYSRNSHFLSKRLTPDKQNRRTDCLTDRTNRQTDAQTDGQIRRTDGQTDGWTDGKTDGQTGRRTDGQTHIPTKGRLNGRTNEQ